MASTDVAKILNCTECESRWLLGDEERWRAYLGGDDLEEVGELVFYCPTCADREFA